MGKCWSSPATYLFCAGTVTATWKKTNENHEFLWESFALACTPDGKQVLVGGADVRLTVLDAATAKQVRVLPAEAVPYIVSLEPLGSQRAATVHLENALRNSFDRS